MVYDQGSTHHIREILVDRPGLIEKEMFGGIGFMLQGNDTQSNRPVTFK